MGAQCCRDFTRAARQQFWNYPKFYNSCPTINFNNSVKPCLKRCDKFVKYPWHMNKKCKDWCHSVGRRVMCGQCCRRFRQSCRKHFKGTGICKKSCPRSEWECKRQCRGNRRCISMC